MGIVNRIKQSLPNFNFTQFADSFNSKDSHFYKKVASYFPSFSPDRKSWYKSRYVYIGLGLVSFGFLMMRCFSKGVEPPHSIGKSSEVQSKGKTQNDDIAAAVTDPDKFSSYVKNIRGILLIDLGDSYLPHVRASKMTDSIMRTQDSNLVSFMVAMKSGDGRPLYAVIRMYDGGMGWFMSIQTHCCHPLPLELFGKYDKLQDNCEMQKFVKDLFTSGSHSLDRQGSKYTFELVKNPSKLDGCVYFFG